MAGTTRTGAPYPTGSDGPALHTQVKNLADHYDLRNVPYFADATARNAVMGTPTTPQFCFTGQIPQHYVVGVGWKDVFSDSRTRVQAGIFNVNIPAGVLFDGALNFPITMASAPAVSMQAGPGMAANQMPLLAIRGTPTASGFLYRIRRGDYSNLVAETVTFHYVAVAL